MSSVTIEVIGESSAAVDEATSSLLTNLANAGVEITPPQLTSERDGGVIALAIAILGGAASIAQVASTIHAMARKKDVQVIVIDSSGGRTPISASKNKNDVLALIERTSAGD